MLIGIIHFVLVYAIPFVMSLNRVGQHPSNEKRIKSILIYWIINVIIMTIEQSLKIKHDYYFIAKSILCFLLYNNITNGAWWIFLKTNGFLGKGFKYDLEEKQL